jgi:hypothetical protein
MDCLRGDLGYLLSAWWMNVPTRCFQRNPDGVSNWNFELGGVPLRRLGLNLDSLKISDQVTVEGYAAGDGSERVIARRLILLADGKKYCDRRSPTNRIIKSALDKTFFSGEWPSAVGKSLALIGNPRRVMYGRANIYVAADFR